MLLPPNHFLWLGPFCLICDYGVHFGPSASRPALLTCLDHQLFSRACETEGLLSARSKMWALIGQGGCSGESEHATIPCTSRAKMSLLRAASLCIGSFQPRLAGNSSTFQEFLECAAVVCWFRVDNRGGGNILGGSHETTHTLHELPSQGCILHSITPSSHPLHECTPRIWLHTFLTQFLTTGLLPPNWTTPEAQT